MKVDLRLFAVAREIAQQATIELEMEEGATVAELRSLLVSRFPELEKMRSVLRFAVNEDYVSDHTTLQPNDDVACIPPVSGG